MNIEFHYHITRLIAARAGFPPEDADIIAFSSQYVDDNSMIFEIDKEMPTAGNKARFHILNWLRKGSNRAPVKIFKVAVWSGALVEKQQAFLGVRQKNGRRVMQESWVVVIS